MKIERIDHFVIPVQNIEASIHFYTNILNMELEFSNNRYAVKFGKQKINLHVGLAEFLPAAKNPNFGGTDLCFIVEENLANVKIELEQKGIDLEEGIVQRNGALGIMESIYLRDPDGNLIELSHYL